MQGRDLGPRLGLGLEPGLELALGLRLRLGAGLGLGLRLEIGAGEYFLGSGVGVMPNGSVTECCATSHCIYTIPLLCTILYASVYYERPGDLEGLGSGLGSWLRLASELGVG